MQEPKINIKLNNKIYDEELRRLQVELVKLQYWVKEKQLKVAIIFEGRDAAGKGSLISKITERLNPRGCRIVALEKPTEKERTQWYFQRYVQHLPSGGEIAIFDRSWYNRAGVERVMDFCSDEEYWEFLRTCPEFERMLVNSGVILLKYWISVSEAEQEKRFFERVNNPLKIWKFSPMDKASWHKWDEYSRARDMMFQYTDTKDCPWYFVDSNDKRKARLNCISHILHSIKFENVLPNKIELGPRQRDFNYIEPPREYFTRIPQLY